MPCAKTPLDYGSSLDPKWSHEATVVHAVRHLPWRRDGKLRSVGSLIWGSAWHFPFWPRGKAEVRTEGLHSHCRPHERICFYWRHRGKPGEWSSGLTQTQSMLGVHLNHWWPDCGRMSRKAPHFCLEWTLEWLLCCHTSIFFFLHVNFRLRKILWATLLALFMTEYWERVLFPRKQLLCPTRKQEFNFICAALIELI